MSTIFDKLVIYVERTAGRYEARYWHTDEQRYFRFTSYDGNLAIKQAAKHSGYAVRECRVIELS